MALNPKGNPQEIADEIERNLNLQEQNTRIWFDDTDWTVIVKALRFYAEKQGD